MSDTVILVAPVDQPDLLPLTAALLSSRLQVRETPDPAAALDLVAAGARAAVVCDATSPAGFEPVRVLAASPERWRFPLLVLTDTADLVGRVVALELGADDALSRPWSEREVALRVRALLRRWASPDGDPALRFGTLTLDVAGRSGVAGGRDLGLSGLEARLLGALVGRRGARVTRQELQAELWGARDTGARALDTVVKRLRRKLTGSGMRLSTIRGAGFRLEPEGAGAGE